MAHTVAGVRIVEVTFLMVVVVVVVVVDATETGWNGFSM
jgi:hypothetical protein